MAIIAGTQLGPYEIIAPIGAGGMGEVFKARDTRLDRTLAIKVLPSHLSNTAEVRERFEREARTISSLNHPNICTLYDVGQQDGIDFLVMEYLEGETLSQRLLKGPMPLDQALKCAAEIAAALETAHRQGVTHRDLKPGNVMLTNVGAKLLDFGLAKWRHSSGPVQPLSVMPTAPSADLTAQGTILGTLQYMSPEQLEGLDADARSDIFAFGALLYEMVTGKKTFEGRSQASLIAAILEKEPSPISTLQPTSPAALERLIQICLAKNPDDRFQSAREITRELKWVTNQPVEKKAAARKSAIPQMMGWVAAFVFAIVAALFVSAYFREEVPGLTVRFSLVPPNGLNFAGANGAPRMALSPDATRLVFGAGQESLWVRPLDSLAARELPGTELSQQPFWSPDGRFIAFWHDQKLKRINADGGPIQSLANVPLTDFSGTWNGENVILFGGVGGPIMRVSADGGEPVPVTTLQAPETAHKWPQFLPDDDHFLYFAVTPKREEGAVFVASLRTGEKKAVMVSPFMAYYADPGYLFFVRDGSLVVQPFDLDRLELAGAAVPIAETIARANNGRVGLTASNGVLAYREESGQGVGVTRLTWFDRGGKELGTIGEERMYRNPALSWDGRQIAGEMPGQAGSPGDIWTIDLGRNIPSRFTSHEANEGLPIWSPDGSRIAFNSNRGGRAELFVKSATGFGEEQQILSVDKFNLIASDWSRNYLVYQQGSGGSRDIYALSQNEKAKAVPVQVSGFDELQGRLSPDERWLAFISNESGTYEVYVRTFPGAERLWQISNGGGKEPRWRSDGKELFFRTDDGNIMSVQISGDDRTPPGIPKTLFNARLGGLASGDMNRYYAVADNGERFLVNVPVQQSTVVPVTVIVNWHAAIK